MMRQCLVLLLFLGGYGHLFANVNELDAFLVTAVSKIKVFEKETFVVSYRLYTNSPVRYVQDSRLPQAQATMPLDIKDVNEQGLSTFKKEQYQGKQYYVTDLKKQLILSQEQGKITVPVAAITIVFAIDTGKREQSFFGTQPIIREEIKTLQSKLVTIEVLSLPKRKLTDFSGAVGQFTLKTDLSRTTIDRGQAVILELTFSGVGSLDGIDFPKLDLPEDLEIADQKQDSNVLLIDGNLKSEKVFYYRIIPSKAGIFTIPSLKFIYFDVEQKKYIQLTSDEKNINVKAKLMQGEAFA